MYCLPKGETIQEAERASVFGRLLQFTARRSSWHGCWSITMGGWRPQIFPTHSGPLSHYIWAVALKDQTARSIVNAFKEGWVYRGHGVPRVIITEEGKNVDGLAVRGLCHDLGIEKRHTTPYDPESNGMPERHIGFVKQVIICLMLERNIEKGSWRSLLPEVTLKYLVVKK